MSSRLVKRNNLNKPNLRMISNERSHTCWRKWQMRGGPSHGSVVCLGKTALRPVSVGDEMVIGSNLNHVFHHCKQILHATQMHKDPHTTTQHEAQQTVLHCGSRMRKGLWVWLQARIRTQRRQWHTRRRAKDLSHYYAPYPNF